MPRTTGAGHRPVRGRLRAAEARLRDLATGHDAPEVPSAVAGTVGGPAVVRARHSDDAGADHLALAQVVTDGRAHRGSRAVERPGRRTATRSTARQVVAHGLTGVVGAAVETASAPAEAVRTARAATAAVISRVRRPSNRSRVSTAPCGPRLSRMVQRGRPMAREMTVSKARSGRRRRRAMRGRAPKPVA